MTQYVNQSSDRLHLIEFFMAPGIIKEDSGYDIVKFGAIRIAIEDVNVWNEVQVEARINGESDWHILGVVSGEDTQGFDVLSYDAVRFNVITYDSPDKGKFILSSFE